MGDHVSLAPRSAFAGMLAPVGPLPAGVIATELVGLGLAAVEPRKGRAADLIAHVEARYGLSPPKSLRRVTAGSVAFLGVGPNRWLAISESGASFTDDLEAALDGAASVIAQTDGLAVLRISGSRVRDTFAKGLPIDLDPRAFAVGDVASSTLAHIGVTIWRADETAYDVAVPRSFARDFSNWLAESAAEFGLSGDRGEAEYGDSVGT
jgi:sarcosine oxidase subunit gamma